MIALGLDFRADYKSVSNINLVTISIMMLVVMMNTDQYRFLKNEHTIEQCLN